MSSNEFESELTINEVLRSQRRSRRIQFWSGFFALAIVGVPWACLQKEPIDARFGDAEFDDAVLVDEMMEAEPDFLPVTSAVFLDGDEPLIEPSDTTGPSTTSGPITSGPIATEPADADVSTTTVPPTSVTVGDVTTTIGAEE